MHDERFLVRGDAVNAKFEFNVDQLTPDVVEMAHRLQQEGIAWSIEFEEPTDDAMKNTDFSLLDWKLQKGGFDPDEDADFILNAKQLSVMADVASAKLKAQSLSAHRELQSFQVKLKSWFVRMLHAYMHGSETVTFYECVLRDLPGFMEEQQRTLLRLKLDSESVWGLIWLLTSKCKVKWHKDGERPPVP